jgi:hypothetical protein
MHRSLSRSCCYLLTLAAASGVVASQGGCTSALMTVVYLFKGTEEEPDFPGLRDKKVAVVCRPAQSLQFGSSSVATEIATEVGKLLKLKTHGKIKVIPQRDVENWIDEKSSGEDDFAQIGDALKADMVLAIELEDFELSQGQTLWQGNSKVQLKVLDLSKPEGEQVVFGPKHMPHVVYPPNAGIPVQDRSEDEFRRQYVSILSDMIGRYFYPHDPRDMYAQDAGAFN